MATRYDIIKRAMGSAIDLGYSSADIPDDFTIPSCTIEDVDRSLFDLFNESLPLFYTFKKTLKRVPIIFATGERFALLTRKKPLRDKNNALILPLISIMRTGIDQTNAKGAGHMQGGPITLVKRLSKDDARYQQVMNKLGFKNSDGIANSIDEGKEGTAGKLETYRKVPGTSSNLLSGRVLDPNLSQNIIEFILIPPIKQYTASYEITFWTQYTQQMNDLLMAMMGGYTQNHQRTFLLETKKGYRFTAFTDASLNPGNNYDDFSDQERLVKYTFTISIGAFLVAPQGPGLPSPFRRFVSAPNMAFGTDSTIDDLVIPTPANIISGDPSDFVLEDLDTTADGYPGAAIAADPRKQLAKRIAMGFPGDSSIIYGSYQIGGQKSVNDESILNAPKVLVASKDPFTGKDKKQAYVIKGKTTKQGETVFRQSNNPAGGATKDLGEIT